MKPDTFPRIVANGKWYRIEDAKGNYLRTIHGMFPIPLIWETRSIRRAIKKLTRLRIDARHSNPDNWEPVL